MAVHCTHGFNRTGFLIAAYLASAMDWAIDAAIYSFAQMRPNGIYKQLYLDELMKRYGDEDDRIEVRSECSLFRYISFCAASCCGSVGSLGKYGFKKVQMCVEGEKKIFFVALLSSQCM